MTRRALIPGVTRQDGAWLAAFPLGEALRDVWHQAGYVALQHRAHRAPDAPRSGQVAALRHASGNQMWEVWVPVVFGAGRDPRMVA